MPRLRHGAHPAVLLQSADRLCLGARQFFSITLTTQAMIKASTIASGHSTYGIRGESVIENLTH